MGQVFTWEAISNREIPTPEDFTIIVEKLRQDISRIDCIEHALVCGSVVRGDHNARSDIDCFIVYDPSKEGEVIRFAQLAVQYAIECYVPLSFIPCDTSVMTTRMHHVGVSFRRHLEKSAQEGGTLKGNPTLGFKSNQSEPLELESYLRHKMYRLQAGLTGLASKTEKEQAKYLQKLFEAPIHVARKVLARIGPLKGDSKRRIVQQYRETMPPFMGKYLREHVARDARYTALVSGNLDNLTEGEYLRCLNALQQQALFILSFVRANLEYVDRLK